MTRPAVPRRRRSPAQIFALGFLSILLVGAVLLCLPISSRSGAPTPFLDALFTATSATCVTGLVVRDTFTYWSPFGQAVILTMIQIGGLGFVTIGLLVSMASGRKIGFRQRHLMQQSADLPQIGGVLRATRRILCITAACELLGAALLAFVFVPQFGVGKGLWFGLFHSISAFCNAGFDLMGEAAPFSSMTGFAGHGLVNLVLMALIIIGGIGFSVWEDVYRHGLHFRHYRLQSKLVLTTTAVLLVVPFLLFYFGELSRPAWQDLSAAERFWGAAMHTVSPRTAGFNTLDYGNFSEVGILLTVLLMLVGGAPGSTAGGLKVTTAATMYLSIRSILRRKNDVEAYGRRLADDALARACVLIALYIGLVVFGASVMCVLDGAPLLDSLFEAASAVATVGLSRGLTPTLCPVSRVILIFLMYLGRIGGLTLLYAVAAHRTDAVVRLPQEDVSLG